MKSFRKLFDSTGGFRAFIVLSLVRCPFDTLRTLLYALFFQYVFGAIQMGSPAQLYKFCLLYGLGSFLLFLYNGIVWAFYSAFVVRWTGRIRFLVYSRISRLDLEEIERQSTGSWITRLNSDVEKGAAILNQPQQLPHFLGALLNTIVSSIFLLAINPKIFLLVLLFLIPHGLISQLVIARPISRQAAEVQELTDENTAAFHTLITCGELTALYDAQNLLEKRFEASSLAMRKAQMGIRFRGALNDSILPLLGMSGYLVILVFSSYWIAGGTLSFSDLVAAFQFRGGVLLGTLTVLSCSMNMRAAQAGLQRLNKTLQSEPEDEHGSSFDENW